MKRLSIIMLALVLVFGMAFAQEDYKKHPGYIDLSGIEIPEDAGEVTEVTIGPELFTMLRSFSGEDEDDDDDAAFLGEGGMFSINVKTFEIDEAQSDKVRAEMAKIEKKLQKENWTPVVRVKSGDETTNVSVKFDKGTHKTLGLLVMSLEPGNEATFVNIVGSIPLEALGSMGVDMNESALDSLKQVLEGDKPAKKHKTK
ncbi:DUF4252 domain-containing protein [bacterium]|nr:DUF4252 domain-containing protein [bacterium]